MIRLPNSGVIWYRTGANDAFRKHVASLDGSKLTLQPTSNTFFRGKVVLDTKTYFIQIIPAARVTGTRGRSSSPPGAVRKEPSTANFSSQSNESPRKTDEERFQSADAYLSLCPRSEGAEGTTKRVVLRTRDLTESMIWQSILLQASGNSIQTVGETYPWGNPVEDVRQKAEQSRLEKSETSTAAGANAATAAERATNAEHTTSSSASSEGSGGERRHTRRKRTHSTPHQRRLASNSVAFDDIPLVKATSMVSRKKDKARGDPGSTPSDDFILTVDSASSDEGSPKKLLPSSRKSSSRRSRIISSTAPLGPQRWRYPHEDDSSFQLEAVTVAAAQKNAYLEKLWHLAQDRENELVFKSTVRQLVETDFAIATISNASRSSAATAAYLFDQSDQRTFGTCKAAIQRNGVPISVINAPLHERNDSAAHEAAHPQLAIAHFETTALRILLPADKSLLVPYCAMRTVLAEDDFDPGHPKNALDLSGGPSTTPTTTEESLSATSSGPKGFSSSARLLRRLSPTPSNTSLVGESVAKALELNSPTSEGLTLESNASLALVIPPPETVSVPLSKFLMHVYYAPQEGGTDRTELLDQYRRGPIHQELRCVTIGFELALERKASMVILSEKQQRHAVESLKDETGESDELMTPADKSGVASPNTPMTNSKLDFSDYLMMATSPHRSSTSGGGLSNSNPGNGDPSSRVFLGAFHNTHNQNMTGRSRRDSHRAMMQYALSHSIVASTDVEVDSSKSHACTRTTIDHLVLDCLQNDMVQLYMQSARRTF
jgi:hypothetical protein